MTAPNVREHVTHRGEPKVSLTQEKAIALVLQRPERKLEAYECSICGAWHVGAKPWGRRWRFGLGSYGVSVRVWREPRDAR